MPRTPQRSLLLDSQTKHDLLSLTAQPTRGPISRLGCAQSKERKKERTWASPSPSVALCSLCVFLVIAESTSDAAATWRGRLFVIDASITSSVIAVLGQNDICGRNLPSLGALYCSSQYPSSTIHPGPIEERPPGSQLKGCRESALAALLYQIPSPWLTATLMMMQLHTFAFHFVIAQFVWTRRLLLHKPRHGGSRQRAKQEAKRNRSIN